MQKNNFNTILIDLLESLRQIPSVNLAKINSLVEISSENIILLGRKRLDELFRTDLPEKQTIDVAAFRNFIQEICPLVIRLNHLGISYFTKDIFQELEDLKNLAREAGVGIYEEASSLSRERWFFLGNKEQWENPLFEIILSQGNKKTDAFRPHFQIDLDTSLSINKIKEITSKYFGKDFISWELNIPGFGVVLGVGFLGEVNGAKIAFGLGTDKRGTKYHREKDLQKLV